MKGSQDEIHVHVLLYKKMLDLLSYYKKVRLFRITTLPLHYLQMNILLNVVQLAMIHDQFSLINNNKNMFITLKHKYTPHNSDNRSVLSWIFLLN